MENDTSWKQTFITEGPRKMFCSSRIVSRDAMNLIVTHTPVCSTTEMDAIYRPFVKYPVNLFAFDFSGTGRSAPLPSGFSTESVLSDLATVCRYIEQECCDQIHLFGNGGIGGIFAQAFVCTNPRVRSFAQFACASYRRTRPLGVPPSLLELSVPILKAFPRMKINFREPPYSGFHEREDNGFYEEFERKNPEFRRCRLAFITALAEIFVSKKSPIQNPIVCPTLVFQTLHDRFFPPEYFEEYYRSLRCEKKLVTVDDVHNSYYLSADLYCAEAYRWFCSHQS